MALRPVLLIPVVLAAAVPAGAWDGASVNQITASVDFELYVDASPTALCWSYWDWESAGHPDVPVIHQVNENTLFPCSSGWTLDCESDSLAWHGWWPEIEPDNYAWNFLTYDAELTCDVYFFEPARLIATRAVTGELETSVHTVEVQPDNGDPVMMLGDVSGPDAAELDIAMGPCTIVVRVEAFEHGTHYAYDGQVHLTWGPQDDTPALASSWSTVKALYR